MSNALPSNADEYWKHLPFKDKGDESHDVIYRAMGRAITVWEGVENLWVMMFCHFVEASPTNAAARAYGSIDSSRGRMDALVNAAEVYFHIHDVSQSLRDEFKFIRTHFDKARGRRNDIAHAVTINFIFQGGEDAAGIFLLPALYGSRKNLPFKPKDGDRFSVLKSKYRLTAADIDFFTAKFAQLQQAVMGYHARLASAHPPTER